MSEDSIQKQLILWANHQPIGEKGRIGDYLHHSPNGGKRSPFEAKKFKQMGTKAGFPDLFLCIARGGYHGLFVELKTAKGKVSPLQQTWLDRLNKQGYKAVVCYGYDEARGVILDYVCSSKLKTPKRLEM